MTRRKNNWARIDSGLPRNAKMRALDPVAKWLYVASILHAKWDRSDGYVRAPVVCVAEDISMDFAEVLIKRGLWHRAGHKCPDCTQPETGMGWVVIHDFLEWQESQESIETRSNALRSAGRRGADKRWAKATPKARAKATPMADPMANPNGVHDSQPIADSDSDSDSLSVAHGLHGLTNDDLTRITALTGGGPAHARKTAAFVLGKIPSRPRDPLAYILAAIANEPDAYRYRRGNPRTADDWCPEPGHEAEWADACRQCALERKLAQPSYDHFAVPRELVEEPPDEPTPDEPDWTDF